MFRNDSSCGLVGLLSISECFNAARGKISRWDASRLFAPRGGEGGLRMFFRLWAFSSPASGLCESQFEILILPLKVSDTTYYILRA